MNRNMSAAPPFQIPLSIEPSLWGNNLPFVVDANGTSKKYLIAEGGLVATVSPVASIQDTLAQREHTHGDFKDGANIAQSLKRVMHGASGWQSLSADKQEALDVIALKISRVLSDNPEFKDTWHDIAGYATLAEIGCQ